LVATKTQGNIKTAARPHADTFMSFTIDSRIEFTVCYLILSLVFNQQTMLLFSFYEQHYRILEPIC